MINGQVVGFFLVLILIGIVSIAGLVGVALDALAERRRRRKAGE